MLRGWGVISILPSSTLKTMNQPQENNYEDWMRGQSNCCQAPIIAPDFCSACMEHCEAKKCGYCGREITDKNKQLYDNYRGNFYCEECEEEYKEEINQEEGDNGFLLKQNE